MTSTISTPEHLAALLRGHVTTQLLATAARIRIADLTAAGPRSLTEISGDTGIPTPALRRYLSALHGLGIVAPVAGDRWAVTGMGALLHSRSGALYGQALMAGGSYYEAWQGLDHSLRTGTSAFEHRYGRTLWESTATDPELAAEFARTMRWNSQRALAEVLQLHDFTAEERLVVDLGAGDATLLCGLLAHHPGLRGLAVEQHGMVTRAEATITEAGLTSRCAVEPGDIRDSVPGDGDTYILKSVIHNWPDQMALRILRNVLAAMRLGSELLLIEKTHDDHGDPDVAIRDLTMLVLFGSEDRSAAQYCALLVEAGFTVEPPRRGPSGLHLIRALPDTSRQATGHHGGSGPPERERNR